VSASNILYKLTTLLSREIPIASELEVVYILVEMGKILERDGTAGEYPLLKFYRDWAVHPRKDRHTDNIQSIVQVAYEGAVSQIQAPFGLHRPVGVIDFAHGGAVKEEVKNFLQKHDLPETLVSEKIWEQFVHLLSNVLAEQPLIPEGVENVKWVEFLPASPGCVVLRIVFLNPVSGHDGRDYPYYDYMNYIG